MRTRLTQALHHVSPWHVVLGVAALALVPFALVALFHSRLYGVMNGADYLVLHNAFEWFSVFISLSIFGFGWYGFDQSKDRHALFLACAFLTVGLIDFMHALGYPGMPTFITPNSTNKSTQLWILVRGYSAICILISAYVRPDSQSPWLSKKFLLSLSLTVPVLVFVLVTFYPTLLPATFVEGQGLTPFKKAAEYLIVCLLVAGVLAYQRRVAIKDEQARIYYFLAAFVLCAFSELSFVLYKSAFDTYNALGHFYKVIAFYLVYRGAVVVSLRRPHLELRASKAALTEAQRIAQIGNWELDVSTRQIRWSEELFRIVDRQPREGAFSLQAALEALQPDDRARLSAALDESLRTRQPFVLDVRITHSDGAQRTLQIRSRVDLDREGQVTRLVGTAQDITDRKLIEEALRRERDLVATVMETSPFGMLRVDRSGKIVFANAQAEKTTGIPRDRITQRTLDGPEWRITGFDGRPFPPESSPFTRLLRGREPLTLQYAIDRPDGQRVLLSAKGAPLLDVGGEIDGAVLVFEDVTERRSLEEQLRQSQKLEAVGRLAGGVAHDFNNLLTAILGGVDQLRSLSHSPSLMEEEIGDIEAAAKRGAALTRQLLTFSRRQVVQPKVIEAGEIVGGMDRLLRRLIGEHIELVTVPSTSKGYVKADPGQIEQVIVNLVVNARDAMPQGGRLVIETQNVRLGRAQVSQHIGLKPGEYVVLSVSDTGCGMSAEIQSHLFEPFFTTKEVGRGTGLGLCTVYGIVKQAGGDVWVHSQEGKGSVIEIYLPRVEEPSQAIEGEVASSLPSRGTECILLVEDDPQVRSLAMRGLRAAGYVVLEAADGEEALRVALRTQSLDLLVTDVVMPRMGGEQLARQLRSVRPGIRVLYVSGYTQHGIALDALDTLSAFLHKPYAPSELLAVVRQLLDRGRDLSVASRR